MITKGLVYARSATGENLDIQAERGVKELRNLGITDIDVIISDYHKTKKIDRPDLNGYTHLYLQGLYRIGRDRDAIPYIKDTLADGVTIVIEHGTIVTPLLAEVMFTWQI